MLCHPLDVMKRITFFNDLEPAELNRIQASLIPCVYAEKTNIFLQGDPYHYVYFVLRGKVKVYKADEQGKEQIINILQEGDMFPHKGFFNANVYPANAIMIEKGTILAMPIANFQALLQANPKLCIKLMAVMESRISDLQKQLEEITLYDVYEQIVYLLIRLAQRHGEVVGKQVKINVAFTNQELASMIGTTRESISRTLNHLKKIGVLKTTTKHHLFINLEQLRQQLDIRSAL